MHPIENAPPRAVGAAGTSAPASGGKLPLDQLLEATRRTGGMPSGDALRAMGLRSRRPTAVELEGSVKSIAQGLDAGSVEQLLTAMQGPPPTDTVVLIDLDAVGDARARRIDLVDGWLLISDRTGMPARMLEAADLQNLQVDVHRCSMLEGWNEAARKKTTLPVIDARQRWQPEGGDEAVRRRTALPVIDVRHLVPGARARLQQPAPQQPEQQQPEQQPPVPPRRRHTRAAGN